MKILTIQNLKWGRTFLVLFGILLTNIIIYPANIFLHGCGVFGWTVSALITKDRPILVNFGLQIPLFLFGYYILIF